jgi:hypothetical protein
MLNSITEGLASLSKKTVGVLLPPPVEFFLFCIDGFKAFYSDLSNLLRMQH